MIGVRAFVPALVVLIITTVACGPSPEEEAADLCGDLGSLHATFDLLLAPPPGATVGQVRGALEKVAPVLDRAAGTEATSQALDERIDDAVEAFRDGLDDLGDDEQASAADGPLTAVRPRLAGVVQEAAAALGCEDRVALAAPRAARLTV